MAAPGVQVAPGDLIDGRYLVESLLGAGGMAVVHRARHTGTGAVCAIKLVHPHLVPRPELVELFLREARVGGRIGKSPHVVEVFDAGFDPERGVPYLVMELLAGETLEARADREGPMPPHLVHGVLAQLADALDQAHAAGVIHRDLKPSNLFLTPGRRGQLRVKVMDFGIAKVLEGDAQRTATQIGTPAYAAPEQMGAVMRAAAARQGVTIAAIVSPATDVWALGLLAYELCTGLPAAQFWGAETTLEIPVKAALFAHDLPSVRAGDRAALLPRGFDAWFARATDTDAAQRWPAAGHAVAELGLLLDAMPGGGAPLPTPTPPPAPFGPCATEVGFEGARLQQAPALRPRSRLRVAGSLGTLVVLAGVAGAVLVPPRLVAAARDGCLAADDTAASALACAEACDRGDASSCGRLAARAARGTGIPRDEARAAALFETACAAGDSTSCAGLGRLYTHGRDLVRDPTRAVQLFKKACAGEPRRGCALLGEAYRDGAGGLTRDDVRAVGLFREACDGGDATGCKDLGGMHQAGRGGLARDEAAAAALYREACDGGELLGCNDLGVLVGSGRAGLARDEGLAAVLYQRACDGGELLACDNLAWMLERGKGGEPVDPARAAELYQRACDAGDARGCGNLGVMVEQGRAGNEADPARAAELYERACNAGDAHACDNLGTMVENGKGGLPRDDERAVSLYRRACDAADLDGCNDLAHMHENGRGGLPRDDARAAALYGRACDGDVLRACVNQGVLLAAGRGGPRDESRAVALWQRACAAGIASGCADLGWAYFLGQGVVRDRPRALELLHRACAAGNAWGCERRDEAEGRRQPSRR